MPGISGENVATADTTKISRSKGSVAADVLEAASRRPMPLKGI
jgi:hypothetical protein